MDPLQNKYPRFLILSSLPPWCKIVILEFSIFHAKSIMLLLLFKKSMFEDIHGRDGGTVGGLFIDYNGRPKLVIWT